MKTHSSDPVAARSAVELTIRTWEVDADLRLGRSGLQFRFDGADVVDRTPPPPGVCNASAHIAESADTMAATGTVSVHVSRAAYPSPPPATFGVNPDAESVLARYQGYLNGREPLQAMAYFCLTFLEAKAETRTAAAKLYRIEPAVLNNMGELR